MEITSQSISYREKRVLKREVKEYWEYHILVKTCFFFKKIEKLNNTLKQNVPIYTHGLEYLECSG